MSTNHKRCICKGCNQIARGRSSWMFSTLILKQAHGTEQFKWLLAFHENVRIFGIQLPLPAPVLSKRIHDMFLSFVGTKNLDQQRRLREAPRQSLSNGTSLYNLHLVHRHEPSRKHPSRTTHRGREVVTFLHIELSYHRIAPCPRRVPQ